MAADCDRTELGRHLNDDKTGHGRQPPTLNLATDTKIFIEKVLAGFPHIAPEPPKIFCIYVFSAKFIKGRLVFIQKFYMIIVPMCTLIKSI